MTRMELDPYAVLGLKPGASMEDIKRAYRRLVQKWHPDVCGKTMANVKRFLAIKDAYVLLKERMSQNKESSVLRFPSGAEIPKESIQEGAFYFVQIPIEKALHGTKVQLEITDGEKFCPVCSGLGKVSKHGGKPCTSCQGRGYRILPWGDQDLKIVCKKCSGRGFAVFSTCSKCHGKGLVHRTRNVTITIPPGTKNGTLLKFPFEGPLDPHGTKRTTLFVEVEVSNPNNWIIYGKDIVASIDIDCWTHLGGGYVTIDTIDGPEKIFITPGEKGKKFIRLKGKGWITREGKRGDMLVRLNVLTPMGPAPKEAIRLIEKLKKIWPCASNMPKALPWPASISDHTYHNHPR